MGEVSIITIIRGIIGLISLMFISYLLSSNKKKIQWKIVFISILIQFVVAISVLKISLIQSIFKIISKLSSADINGPSHVSKNPKGIPGIL